MKYLDFPTPASRQAGEFASQFKLANHGLINLKRVYWNLPEPALYEEAVFRGEAHMVRGGPLVVHTQPHTARAAADKFIVREPNTEQQVWWGNYNRPVSPAQFSGLLGRMQAFLQGQELFVQDCFAAASPEHRLPIRIITDTAWQSLFARNMFLTTDNPDELHQHVPQFTVLALPSFKADPRVDGTRSETAIIINFQQRLAIIANTAYGGEIKKTIFTVLNYLLPNDGVMPMHCSANVGTDDDVALFFGLSGTGKTTLSADPRRRLIGDDEHGWSDEGVFNFEGGCYAKVIRLSPENEPQIHAATHAWGTILENVVFDPASRRIDLDDDELTENTRASYPIEMIPNVILDGMVRAHPRNVIFLTCDAQGVLPPIARLSQPQAMYHFISGYTSKIAGTEIGLGTEPEMTFSACFGAPFMVHHPFQYARLLADKMARHGATCWLVNTGWTGGRFGIGKRISIRHTRQLLNAALRGDLRDVKYRKDKLFGFDVPLTCPEVPGEILDASQSWGNKDDYWKTFDALAARYQENFKLFADGCPPEIAAAGPRRLTQAP